MCYKWAQGVLQNDINDEEAKYLHKYSFVVAIILRLISTEQLMLNVLSTQFSFLSINEICGILNLIETNPKLFLLLQDGFDEYSGRTYISKIISKEEYPDVLCITTSRPHAVEQLRRQTSQAVEHHVRLCGFSKDQVKQYIKQFCEYHNKPPETGEELTRVLFDERPDILEVAKIPIRTEMICTVWMVYGKLGETLADLYELFIKQLITHWLNKHGFTDNKDNVKEHNKPWLLKVGNVSNQWEKYNQLRIVFSTKELKEILGEDFNKVIDMGLIVKSHPSNRLEESKWSFPHLTIQEYFVAYLLGNTSSEADISSFTAKCKNYKVLRRCEVIFTFLFSKYSDVANKILTRLILEEKDKTGCKELIDFIFMEFPHFDISTLDIPLPCFLQLKSDKNKDEFNTLLQSDQKQEKPNLKHLVLDKLGQFGKFMEAAQIKNLKFTVSSENEEKSVIQRVNKLVQLTTINITSKVSLSTGDAGIMKNINTDRLTDLSVTAPGALEAVADSIQRFTALQLLHVDDTSRDSNKLLAQGILSSLRNNNNMKQVSLCVQDLDDRIIKEKLNMKVKLKVKERTLSEGSLRKAVRGLDFTEGLYKLDLSGNNLRDQGLSVGKLMARMTTLRVLCVCDCNIQAVTVQAMTKAVTELQVICHLHTFDLSNNNIDNSGLYLGKLAGLMPDIHRLDLGYCGIGSTYLSILSRHLPESNEIHYLDLCGNNLGDATGGASELTKAMVNLKNISVGGSFLVKGPDPIPAICGSVAVRSLNNLHVLDMSYSQLQCGSLCLLGQHLQSMNKLQVMILSGIYNVRPHDYRHVYQNVPESLQHLNVWSDVDAMYGVRLDAYQLVEYKEQLKHLQRLNINIPDTDLDMVQELLEQDNPDIHVYNDENETLKQFPYAENLKVTINCEEEHQHMSEKLKKITQLTSIGIKSKVSLSKGDACMMKNINTDRLTVLSVTAPGALQTMADSIQRFTALQQLHVNDTSRDSNKLQAQRILLSLRKNNNMKQVSLCIPGLDDSIMKEKFDMKVKVQVMEMSIRQDCLKQAVKGLDISEGLYELDLSGNNLRYEGESLGKLMVRMTALRILSVCRCSIEAESVQAIVKAIRELKEICYLQTLNMSNNKLEFSGLHLGNVIELMPDLHRLGLENTNLTAPFLAVMSKNVTEHNKLHMLDLCGNNLGDVTGGGSELFKAMLNLQAIKVGGSFFMRGPDPIPAVCGAIDAGFAINLRILDMSYSKLHPGSLQLLGQHLPNMNKLQVISLKGIYNVKPDDYHHLYRNVPESLQHLNVWSDPNYMYYVRLDGYLLAEYKQQLRHLHRLNVNIPDTDLDMVHELLEQHNPYLHVYNDKDEEIWKMYVTLDESQD